MHEQHFDDEALLTYIKQLRREMADLPHDNRLARVTFMKRLWGALKSHDKL